MEVGCFSHTSGVALPLLQKETVVARAYWQENPEETGNGRKISTLWAND